MIVAPRRWMVLLAVGLVMMAGCTRSPEAKKARHLARGDTYFSRQQYREALIEYRNVLRIEATNPRAIRQLGLAHYQIGELGQAFRYLRKSQELAPDDLEVRGKLGNIYLVGRKLKEAREQAAFVLEKDPKNLDALILLASAARTSEEVAAAIHRLQEARADFADRAKFPLTLGALYLRKRDVAGAEAAFQEAVAREPKSVDAHLALGDFYTVKRDVERAEQEFKLAAELAPVGSSTGVKLADFYLLVGKPEEAKRVLEEITDKASHFLPAWRRLAEMALADGKYDESVKALQVILKKNPSDPEGHLLRGRVHLAKRETTEAIQEFQRVLKLEPRLPPARYDLALAQLQAGNAQQAKAELTEATSIDPNFVAARLLLAQLNIRTGAPEPAIKDLEQLVAKQPIMSPAYKLLGVAYLTKRDSVKAELAYRKVTALAPKDPSGPYLVGLSLQAQGKRAEARKEFEAALSLAPDYVEPLVRLVSMAFAEKQPNIALDRVHKQIALVPKSGALQYLLGEVYLARREMDQAETAYLKAVELEPRLMGAYVQLGNLYAAQGKDDQALAKLNEALKVNPKNVVALMLSGVIYGRKGDIAKAQEAYEKALELNPRFAPAANNLAWLYSEYGGDKEKALQLAQKAKGLAPDDPRISDTLGWILYKRGVYKRALSLLKESADKLPENEEVQQHLRMAALKAGDEGTAIKAASGPLPAAKPEGVAALAPSVTPTIPKTVLKTPSSAGPGAREPKNRAPATSKETFWIQVGVFEDSNKAARLAARLQSEHYRVLTRPEQSAAGRHVVWVGDYPTRQQAEAARVALEGKGFPGLIVERQGQ